MKMVENGYYGEVVVPLEVFNTIPDELVMPPYHIEYKYLLSNDKETKYLQDLGIEVSICVDYFKIYKED